MTGSPLPTQLNLGCGAFKKPGFLNVDADERMSPDLLLDLNKHPFPFPDGHFTRIEADHVLEHLQDPFAVMRELHRICAPDGLVQIRVPHFSRGLTHADHKRGFDVAFPLYFQPDFKPGWTGSRFDLQRMRLRWYAQPYLKESVFPKFQCRIGESMGAIIDWFANLNPWVCSRLWCFWVGGFEEIEFQFICRK
jgi:SAM-dependent methyltransferase